MMIARLPAAVLLATAVLAGCTIARPALERQSFVVDAERTGAPAPVQKPVTLKVGLISVASPFAARSLVYRVGDLRYEADPYSGFFAAPRDLLGQEVAEWLSGSGLFAAVRAPRSPATARYVLDGFVTELYGDARDASRVAAVLTIRFYLHEAAARDNALFERQYAQRVDVGAGSPEALVHGYGAALARILTELERDLARLELGK